MAALQQIRAQRPDNKTIYVILDNLSAHKGGKIRTWCAESAIEVCVTPTYSSWANPIECQFGPLREFVLNSADHPSHLVVANKTHAYLRWRNAKHPDVLAAQRKERLRIRSERQRRWGQPRARGA